MNVVNLQKIIAVTFSDQKLLRQAFVHRSYLNESREFSVSNERLEFLGDAVLSFLTSEYLYKTYPDKQEGILTNVRSSLVKTTSLAQTATELKLGEYMLLSRGEVESGGRNNPSLLADTFEALLGAIFLDQGTDACRAFLTRCLFDKADAIVQTKSYIDYKSLLQEIVQEKSRQSPVYRTVRTEGPDHAKTFWVEAVVDDRVAGGGSGKSKQEAEQQAAKAALTAMGQLPGDKQPQTV